MMVWTTVFLLALFLVTAMEVYLSFRQSHYVQQHRTAVPPRFASVITLDAHQKAADYTLAKHQHGLWAQAFSVILLLAWTLGGGLNAWDQAVSTLAWSPLWIGVAVMLGFFVIGSLLEIPLAAWQTFGLETRFGFNSSTWQLYVVDHLKQLLLMLLIGGPLIALLLWLMQEAGEWWWWYAWLVWTAFSLLMMWAFPTLIAPLFNRFEPLEDGEARTRIEALLQRCGFACNGLFVMDGSRRSSHGNAYFTGMGRSKRIVFFDTLLKNLTIDEAEAVLAHELGHFHHGHVKQRIISMTLFSLVGFALLGWIAEQPWFYHGLGISHASNYMALLLFMLVLPLFSSWLSPLMNAFSRKHEFQADAYAVAHSSGEALVEALTKLYRDNAATLTTDPWYSAWHDSHPPASVRIAQIDRHKHHDS
ncbi:MAG: M48 family metallopeptidase [Mariprofundaceae bacterium]|nr:M48 family metallopeptidase [Mariprofundaceae bacterium]